MGRTMKRYLALLLCLLLCLSLFPATAFAEEGDAEPTEEIAELTEPTADADVIISEEAQAVTDQDACGTAEPADAAEKIIEEEPAAEDSPVAEEVPIMEEADAPEEESLKTASTQDGSDSVREYVERCYRVILGREGDPDGIDNWVSALVSGYREGAEIVHDFIFSPEFTSHQYPDDEVVAILYRAMLGRDPDPDGKANWLAHLNNGMSYDFIINGFSGSQEFGGICASYGIRPGSVALTEPRDQNPLVTAFVNRNYLYALERKGEPGGLNNWTNALLLRQQTPQEVAHGFVFSPECVGRNLSDRAFIEMLYHLYMDRDPDEGGMNYYLQVLAGGTSREQIEANFGASPEFTGIVESYGLSVWDPDIVFATTDLYGNPYNDSVFANANVTMLNLWAYWCGPCVGELKDLQKLQNNYANRGFQILGVSFSNYNEYNIKEFQSQGISYPSLIATQTLYEPLYTGSIPTTIFVDRNGHILCDEPYVGARDYNSWAKIVEGYLG